jgi:uncharacterized protein YqjF (DUF2071 family)
MKQNDFDYSFLEQTAHRPWPMPQSAWIMTQSWHDLLFAHWPVDKEALRDKVPNGFTVDTFEGQAWVGVIPFHMTNVAPRGLPALPWVSVFPELNVRTYVTVHGKPGVYFFSLDAGNPVAAGTARTLFHLPYYCAAMKVEEVEGWMKYDSRRHGGGAELKADYRPVGPARDPVAGTLDHFLTERYCLYTVDGSFRPYRLEIHHRPWPLQAAEARIGCNTMADAAGIRLPSMAPVLHFSKRQDIVAWPLEGIEQEAGS